MVDNNDLNFNAGGGQPAASKKSVRMHVMPEDIFSEDELHRKINKLPARKVELPRKEAPVLPKKEEKVEVAKEIVETIIPSGLKRPAKKKKMATGMKVAIVMAVFVVLAGAAGAAWYFYNQDQQSKLGRDLDLIQDQDQLQDELAAEEAARLAEEAAKAEADKKERLIRDNQRILDIIAMQKALKSYNKTEEKYPMDLPNEEWSFNDVVYMEDVPKDPVNQSDYRYLYNSTAGESYSITFMLEEGVNGLTAGIHSIMDTELLTINGSIQKIVIEEDLDVNKLMVLTLTRDTDLDGVTDLEEFMYGTDPQLFDSDDDTYTDHQEILNLYAPSGMAPQTLLDVGLVNEYYTEKQNYRIYYPSVWRLQAIDVNDEEIMFVSDQTAEYITIKIEDNIGELSLEQWIRLKMHDVEVDYEAEYYQEEFLTKDKEIAGIWLPELFMIFFENGSQIYSMTYNFDGLRQLSYKTTFEMMAKSFRFEGMDLVEEEGDEEILVEGEGEEGEVLDHEESNDEVVEEGSEEEVNSEFIESEIEEELAEESVEGEELPVVEGEGVLEEEGELLLEEEPVEGDAEIDETLDEFYGEELDEEIVEEEPLLEEEPVE